MTAMLKSMHVTVVYTLKIISKKNRLNSQLQRSGFTGVHVLYLLEDFVSQLCLDRLHHQKN